MFGDIVPPSTFSTVTSIVGLPTVLSHFTLAIDAMATLLKVIFWVIEIDESVDVDNVELIAPAVAADKS